MQIDSQLAMDILTLVGKDPAVSVYKRLAIALARESAPPKKPSKKVQLVKPEVHTLKAGK